MLWPRTGSGRKRSVSVAGGLVGTGGKSRGCVFPDGVNGRVFSAGSSKRGSKTPLFTPGVGGATARHALSTTALAAACPNNKGCARTGIAQDSGASQEGPGSA